MTRSIRYLRGVCGAALLASVAALVVLLGSSLVAPVLGLRVIVIASGSMAPAIPTGSAVVVGQVAAQDLHANDVVTFEGANGVLVTHRVADVVAQAGGIAIVTKGDANATPDPVLVPASSVRGRVVLSVPAVGYLLSFGSSLAGRIALLSFLLFLILSIEFLRDLERELGRRRRPTPEAADGERRRRNLDVPVRLLAWPLIVVIVFCSAQPALARFTASRSVGGNALTTWSWVFYLHNSPTPPTGNTPMQSNLTMTPATPTYAGGLPQYSTDCGNYAGRVVTAWWFYPAGCDRVAWTTAAVPAPTNIAGTATLRVWVQGTASARATLYDVNGGAQTQIGTTTITATGNWTLQTDSIAIPAGTTLATGHALRLEISSSSVFAGTLIAYDTTTYASSLSLR